MALILQDPEKLGHILANQKPLWKPGTNHGYHPVTFAIYLDQIVRRADPKGRTLSKYFEEEIAKPFGKVNYQVRFLYVRFNIQRLRYLWYGECIKHTHFKMPSH